MEKHTKLPAIYAILIGILMIAQWIFFLVTGQVPELQSEPWRIALHLVAEFSTAIGLIVSGMGVLRRTPWSNKAYLFFAGMLVYSVIASPGYFAQQGQWLLVAMFVVFFILAIVSLVSITRKEEA